MHGDGRTFQLDLAGQQWTIEVPGEAIEGVHRPILALLNARASRAVGRWIVFLAGPPGSGKTTLAALWSVLAREDPRMLPLQPLPLDGFHYRNERLARTIIRREGHDMHLNSLKGSPETFDVVRIRSAIEAVRAGKEVFWPFYDRKLHDPVENAIRVTDRGIILIEGNYLLLDESGWRDLMAYADYTIFIESTVDTLDSILERLQRGGKRNDEALRHHRFVDHPNYHRVMGKRTGSHLTVSMDGDRTMSFKEYA
jgi:hypothetical protein